jgi:predicted DNA-binding protein
MVHKSIVRAAIVEALEEHDIEDSSLADDILDRILTVAPDEVFDDEEDESEDEG